MLRVAINLRIMISIWNGDVFVLLLLKRLVTKCFSEAILWSFSATDVHYGNDPNYLKDFLVHAYVQQRFT